MLTAAQAKLADQALQRVIAAAATLKAAVEGENLFITWWTGSESAASARRNALRVTEGVVRQLEEQRPTLAPSRLVGFCELASTAADVGSIVADAKRMTAAGFTAEVVAPTLEDLNPLNFSGPVGKAVVLAAAAFVIVQLLKRYA